MGAREESYWREIGQRFRLRLRETPDTGISKQTFVHRGSYGYYFTKRWESFVATPE